MPLTALDLSLVGIAALFAGMVNALAGGGTLLTFPMLTAVGVPAVAANVTNTVALCPGFLGGIFAQRRDLAGQTRRLWLALPAGIAGGFVGGLLLLHTREHVFRVLIPYLILAAATLLALQDRVRGWLRRRAERPAATRHSETWAVLPVGLGAVYGGYFGAGLGVILLATLGLILDDSLTRVNALKQTVALGANGAAAVLFLSSGQVVWPAAIVMAFGAIIGGTVGGRLAGRIPPARLRAIVVVIGVIVAGVYFVRS